MLGLIKFAGRKALAARCYVRRKPRIRIEAQVHGGRHERGMRSGTLPVHADRRYERLTVSRRRDETEMARLRGLQPSVERHPKDIEEVYLNGDARAGRAKHSQRELLTTLKASR